MFLRSFHTLALILTALILNGMVYSQTTLKVKEREINVNGKKSAVLEVIQDNGVRGLTLNQGDWFNVVVDNQLKSPTCIHWHGILLPNNQDGVPYVSQLPIQPGEKYPYRYLIKQSGTYWMHSHFGLQEQLLLSAPLILHDPQDKSGMLEVVMFLSDFTFRNPYDIFKELRQKSKMSGMSGMEMKPDLNDVKYDSFLTNWRTLQDPDLVLVKPGQEVRLRIINGSSSSNFFIDLGALNGEAIAVDGSDILPLNGNRFELATAQRIDIKVKIPASNAAYPIIAQGEGTDLLTGLFLTTSSELKPAMKEKAQNTAGALTYEQEKKLKAKTPLAKKEINRRLVLNLDGNMELYEWMLNGRAWPNFQPLFVKEGERVELAFVNQTMMSHPMHLHGHFFQITEINGQQVEGALRDTILVLPKTTVKIQFDANNPGNWALHCHNLYHLYAGMMTTLNYEGFNGPKFEIKPEN